MAITIKDFNARTYQETIFNTSVSKNTLVVLPTGLGKTAIAMMLAVHRLALYPKTKIVFFAPTKPLADQHLQTFKDFLDLPEEEFVLFTGNTKPEKRQELWKKARFIFSTPQGFENDIISARLKFDNVSLAIFDESHRAVKDYSYVYLASEYFKQSNYQRILALTASPGSKLETVNEVIDNLFIEAIEFRKTTDLDVAKYMHDTSLEQLKVSLPEEIERLRKYLDDCFKSKLNAVKKLGLISGSINSYSITNILALQSVLFAKMREEKDFKIMKAISLLAEAGKIQHAIELVETQTIYALNEYLKKLQEEALTAKSKAIKNLVIDKNFKAAKLRAQKLIENNIEHPKIKKLQSLTKLYTEANPDSKVIIFTQFRNNALRIKEFLDKKSIESELFFGQAKKNGIGHSQKQQKQTIIDFKENKFRVLIATSVAEEGLDIPSVDLVVFYETIPSAIRTVQRRGRTGRHSKGRIITLITKNTRDESFKWVSHFKEKRMYDLINQAKKKFALRVSNSNQTNFLKSKILKTKDLSHIKIFADYREKGSAVLKELLANNVSLKLDSLSIGDFLLSERTIVEFKNVEDFVNSILDKRIFDQAIKLKNSYENKILIIQGQEDIYSVRMIHPNAIRGALASLLLDFGISVIKTSDYKETAALLIALAKREQDENKRAMIKHSSKPLTIKEQQEFIVSSFPGIGNTLNKPLLKHFHSMKNIVNASESALKKVELIGKIKAKKLFELFNEGYL